MDRRPLAVIDRRGRLARLDKGRAGSGDDDGVALMSDHALVPSGQAPRLPEETGFDEVLAPVDHKRRLAVVGVMALAALASYLEMWRLLGLPFDVVGLVATLLGGWPVWKEAWEAIRERHINMEITMALGVGAALVIGQFATGAIIVAFTLFSMYLEDLTKSRGKRALEVLLRAAPQTANVRRAESWVEISVQEVAAGDRVLVKPGEKIPVDGVVVSGASSVVEAAITGEPFPREKQAGAGLFAGTINGSGALEMRADRTGEDTTYARIVGLVKQATERPGRTQRLADRVAQGIVYVVLATAVATWLYTHDPIIVVSVILSAGACGVAAGTPLAILAVTANQTRRGVVIKGGEAVEALARVDTVVFDKTGTLTLGEPDVEEIHPFRDATPEDVLLALLAVEEGSDHPIAHAVLRTVRARNLQLGGGQAADDVQYVAGRGLVGRLRDGRTVLAGNVALLEERGIAVPEDARARIAEGGAAGRIPVLVARDEHVLGLVLLSDRLRAEAKGAIERLHAKGMRVVMLTGDHEGPANDVAERLGIREVRANLLPEDKVRIVQALRAQGRKVCMVGDGINDAPALMEADVGVAVAVGSEVALESADVLLMTNDLNRLVGALEDARQAHRVILFNFGGTVVVDFVGMGLAAFGMLGPIGAALVHVGSELAFILNSARLFGRVELTPPPVPGGQA
ncbi:MAG: cation-translocating P-type ATPase [Pseudomonadota bacterium]|nr:cation-translocating P-type ATPase [Pseudomonadota bacterium]